ncbi:MAG: hypothetical protein AAFQ08_03955, partial [Bacteroidota bacterium]
MFIWFAIPAMDPVVFQRISMSRNVLQVKRSFRYAGIISLFINLFIVWLVVLLLADNRNLEPDKLFNHIIESYAPVGFKGFIGVGVMALAMSTADSYLNASAVLFANDIVKSPHITAKHEAIIARMFCGFSGIIALFLALYANNILELLMISNSFYMPIVTVPLLLAIFGFHSSPRAALIGMGSGFITVLAWYFFADITDSILPGMVINLVAFLGTHYFLGEPGGWRKVEPNSLLGRERAARKEAWERRLKAFKDFRLYAYFQQNLPAREGVYFWFGVYAVLAVYSALYVIAPADVKIYNDIYQGIVHAGMFATAAFLTLPIWPPIIKDQRFITFFWPLGISA